MIIGIEFKIPNSYGNYLKKIFQGVCAERYEWEIGFEEIYKISDNNDFLSEDIFDDAIAGGATFFQAINKGKYYMIFADFKAYLPGEIHDEVKTLRDFLLSNCQMVFLCSDCEYIELCSKDKSAISTIYQNCINEKFTDIKYIDSSELDRRLYG